MGVDLKLPLPPQDGFVTAPPASFGSLRAIVRNPLAAIPRASYQHRLTVTRLFRRSRIHLTDPALIQEVFVGTADALEKTDINQRILGPALGHGLLTAEGAHWRSQRRAIAPAFQHDRLDALLPIMIAAAEATRGRWLAAGRRGENVDVGNEMMRTTFDIIVETMLSGRATIDVERVERSISDYLAATPWVFALGLVGAPTRTPFPGRRRFVAASGYLRGAVNAMVADRRGDARGAQDLVELLLRAADPETGIGMTDEAITDNILTFVTAGHETTANALTWTLALLVENPHEMAAVVREIDAVVGDGPVRREHIGALTYTRQAFNEALRLYPPAPMIARRTLRAFDLSGIQVPEGTRIVVPIYALHRNARVWSEPTAFSPRRFDPDAVKGRHRYSFMPFGVGPRICIGSAFAVMEAVAILAVLLKSIALEAEPAGLPEPMMQVTLRPSRAVSMRPSARVTA